MIQQLILLDLIFSEKKIPYAEWVLERRKYIIEHANSPTTYNICMSRFSVDLRDPQNSQMIQEAAHVPLGSEVTERLVQKHISLLHMTQEDVPIIVDAWSEAFDISEDIDFEEGIRRQNNVLISMYEKLITFWNENPGTQVIGYVD